MRLQNAGVRGQHLRYTAPLVHLDHPRGYADPEKIRRHKAHIREVRRSRAGFTPDGIVKANVEKWLRDRDGPEGAGAGGKLIGVKGLRGFGGAGMRMECGWKVPIRSSRGLNP